MGSATKHMCIVSTTHIFLGVFSIVIGVVCQKVCPSYHNAMYGMGVWLGGWMIITGTSGLVAAHKLENYCRLGGFIGCCLIGIVTMLVCSIMLGLAAINHYSFEATVTREYYKGFHSNKYDRANYYKPQEYFDERNRLGRKGLGIYGTLLCIIILDVLTSMVACYIAKRVLDKQPANVASGRTRGSGRRRSRHVPIRQGPPMYITGPQVHDSIQGGFTVWTPPYSVGPKLPSYSDLYPESSPPFQLPTPVDPPPEYNLTSTDDTHFNTRL